MASESHKETVRYWGMRLGGGGKFVEHGRKGSYITIGWNELGNIEWLANTERSWSEVWTELTEKYRSIWGGSDIQVGQGCGQVIKFARQIKEDDIVAIPDMARKRVLVGRVTGPYEYKDNWGDGCPYPHRRTVKWIREDVKRDEVPTKLKTSLGSLLTVFSLDHRKQEIMTILGQKPPVKEQIVTGAELAKIVIERLFNMEPQEFEEFITALFSLAGFEAATTQYVGDKGVDVIGTLNPEGLTSITLKAQVRRVRGSIGIGDIQQLRGALEADEHGVFITAGSFSKQAQEEAQAERKKPIALIDKEMLVDLILSHYDELDESYKELLQLRKRDVPLREQFYTK